MSITQVVKQLGAALVAVVTVALVTMPGHAFTSISSNTYTASAAVTGGATSMSIALLNNNGSAASGSISWTAAVGSTWTIANQYLQITSHMSQQNGAFIQTYTNNTLGTASPRYTGTVDATHASPAGLINTSSTTLAPLPTAWLVTAATAPAVGTDDPNCTGAVTQPAFCRPAGTATGYAWFYHEDKGQVANNQGVTGPFVNGASYVEVETAGVPANIQYAQGSFGGGAATGVNNLFLEANFASASGGATYQTSTLTVELATP